MISSNKQAQITAQHIRLQKTLKYIRSTGEFVALVNGTRRYAKEVVGTLRKDGAYIISFEGALYTAGKLAYFWVTGVWPRSPVAVKVKTRTRKDYAWNNLIKPSAEV